MDDSLNLPRWVYIVLALLTATIGLASSAITAKFFILGLERLEPDTTARNVLVATGLLMIATELAAFGIAALLPANKLRSVRAKLMAIGLLLLAFEAATICLTQGALDQASESVASATTQRIQELQASIQARRATAQSLRANGATQSASTNAWTRTLGAAALRDALKVESQIDPLASELAKLQSSARPTTASVIGNRGMVVYGTARGLLISAMGLIMFGAAGALLRESMTAKQAALAAQAKAATAKYVKSDLPIKQADTKPAIHQTKLNGYVRGRGRAGWGKMLQIPKWLNITPQFTGREKMAAQI